MWQGSKSAQLATMHCQSTRDHSDAIAQALDVGMVGWWDASVANHLERVSKAKALDAVKEATDIDAAQAMASLKNAEVTMHCAISLEDSRWLPAPLRVISEATHDEAP